MTTKERIESILEAETDVLENIPENLQGTERYEVSENACASMEEAIGSIDEAIESLQNIDGVG